LACGIKVLSAVLVELDLDALVPFKSRTNRYARMPEFPKNDYDISFLVDSMVKWDDIYGAIMAKKNELLRDVKFVDEYKGKQIPAGKKSVTVRLVIGSDEKTLTGAEIEALANAIIKRLGKTIGAEVRA
jgi:phenylalanyl-tRNA synthetase beta chain